MNNQGFGFTVDEEAASQMGEKFLYPEMTVGLMIVAHEIQLNKKQNGHWIRFQFQILDGQFKNKQYSQLYNYDNPADFCREKANQALSAMAVAMGLRGGTSPTAEQMYNIPFTGEIGFDGDNNEIKSYAPSTLQAPAPQPQFAPQQPAQGFAPQQARPQQQFGASSLPQQPRQQQMPQGGFAPQQGDFAPDDDSVPF